MKRLPLLVLLAIAVSFSALSGSFASSFDSSQRPVVLTGDLGPSLITVSGRQLIVRRRNPDGTLAPPALYIIRGVNWSPASRDTNTSPFDPNNANVRRPEFGIWATTDIPLIRDMKVNTVRTFIDVGLDATGMSVLDHLYSNGIMVVMTVDDAINDLTRVEQAVNFFKDHPAILMWMIGSEWNINRYFGVASSVQDAAQRTQTAASLIKMLDANHPVATSYGEIDIDADGLRLADTQNYVNNICTSVDVWGLNIYRGNRFGNLFDLWRSISTKPMLIGEFGTDAFRSATTGNPPPGTVDGVMQAQWVLSEWNDLFGNLSAGDPARVALGGFVFEWNDEWWKVSPPGSQQTSGFVLINGHPDDFANEEFFGIVDIDRQARPVYGTLAMAFDPSYQPPGTLTYRAISRGATAEEFLSQFGVAWFFRNGERLYRATGGAGGGRGFNVAVIDPCTGMLRQPIRNFDSWTTRSSGAALCDMIGFLDSLPNGTVVIIAVADEAGLNNFPPNGCTHLINPCIEPFFQKLEEYGSKQIRSYCYWNSFVMVAVKGKGAAREEHLEDAIEVSGQIELPSPAMISPASQSFAANGGNGSVSLIVPDGCNWNASSSDGWITVNTPNGTGSGSVNYTVAAHSASAPRAGTLTVAGQTFVVAQGAAFLDVPVEHPFYTEIGKLSARGVTLGCGGGNFCPELIVARDQMAAFIIRALKVFDPPVPAGQRFNDVPPSNAFYAFIEQMALRQITLGCTSNTYCPSDPVLRDQMAAFIIRALGEFNPPEPAMQRFADVPPTNPFYRFIDRMAMLQITLGCGGGNYCPSLAVTRGQMAAFLVRAFGL